MRGNLRSTPTPHLYIFTPQLTPIPGWISSSNTFQPDSPPDISLHPGWKTQFLTKLKPNITLTWDGEIFYGFGNCPHVPLAPAKLLQAENDEDVIAFYLQLLRTHCNAESRKHATSLLRDGFLVVRNKILVVPEDSKYL